MEERPAVGVADWSVRRRQWLKGLLVGLMTGAFFGIVLGILGMLPLLLGLFFFLLFGAVPGAVLFRFWDPIRPIPGIALWGGSLLVLVLTFVVSLYAEYYQLPGHVSMKVRMAVAGGYPKGYRRALLDSRVHRLVSDYLRERYGTPGPLAYLKWAASSGKIEIAEGPMRLDDSGTNAGQEPVVLMLSKPAVHRLHQPGKLWIIRVVGSLLLFALAMAMQVAPLRKPRPCETKPVEDGAQAEGKDA
ncbi:MAG: hypothetical protein JXQ73_31685 [Phycisphaerae bacterium]|nr:hypothetical protein [Phycisphaerae bacterium]